MHRDIIQDAVLLSGFIFFTIVLALGDANRLFVVLGGVVVILQALRLIQRVRRLKRGGINSSQ
ncbi:hypothetical protein GTR02_21095 [Kineococcus sp. R8]|uniref:hypothetical protein n=1 Tax=Kineococcus siccus TaxID=2696567 RepID=UPI001411F914|nr:hypothetical protein [Kineococcus siccus]NAZ84303.1 hypothetical protein [Kineococcus siccus]